MSDIKVSDEVWAHFHTNINGEHTGWAFKTNVLELSKCNRAVKIDDPPFSSWCHIKQLVKIEPTFVITTQDVGRFARTRIGSKAIIVMTHPSILEDETTYFYAILNTNFACVCYKDGGLDKEKELEHDLVAWWDE